MSLKTIWAGLTSAEKKRLAELTDTTVGTLRQWAGSYRSTKIKPENALAVIKGLDVLRTANRNIPMLTLRELSPTCAGCPHCPEVVTSGLERNLELGVKRK